MMSGECCVKYTVVELSLTLDVACLVQLVSIISKGLLKS